MRTAALFALTLAATSTPSAQSSPLPNNEVVGFSLEAQSLTTQLVFDVPAGTRLIAFDIDSATADVDIDLMVRHGSPFAFDVPDFESFLDQSQYYSISPGAEEFVAISDASHFPAREGRWYLAVFNLSDQQAEVTVRAVHDSQPPSNAPIVVDYDLASESCSIAEWNAQRRAALDNAVARLSGALRSTVPVRVRACWRDYGESSNTLASAGPSFVATDFPGAPRRNTWFTSTTVARQAGTTPCKLFGGSCASNDLTVTFNSRIDDPSRPANLRWHYDTGNGPVVGFDFVSVAMHELIHGLGFIGLIDVETGRMTRAPRDDIYLYNTIHSPTATTGPRLTELETDAQRLTALTSQSGLYFDAPGEVFPLTAPGQLYPLPLHAPGTPQPGSSLSHISVATGQFPPQLMAPTTPASTARRELGFAALILDKVGWDPTPKAFPTFPLPRPGQWFDPSRNGHGIEFSRVADVWVMTMYSYDAGGAPEYFQAVGPLVDGKYVPLVTAGQSNLVRYLYDADRMAQGLPPQFADPDPSFVGRATLDFVDAGSFPACRDDFTEARATSDTLHAMRWLLDDQTFRTWCMTPLLPDAIRTGTDFTGLWFAGESDPGYGFSITNAEIDGRTLLFAVLYYPDAAGVGRWVYAFTDDYQPGQALPLVQRIAYCRTCAFPPGAQPWTDREVGEVTFNLVQPAFFDPEAGNSASFWIEVPDGPAAGRFERDIFDLIMLTEPVQP